MNIRTD